MVAEGARTGHAFPRLACIGIDPPDTDALGPLIVALLNDSRFIGRAGGVEVRCWDDPSGARIVFATRKRQLERALPTITGLPAVDLARVQTLDADVSIADVLVDGGIATRLAAELEERDVLRGRTCAGRASLVALGHSMEAFADEAAFGDSTASLLVPEGPQPASDVAPVRMGPESFISTGMFAEAFGGPPSSGARLAGRVLAAERRRNAATGLPFDVIRVRTVGIELDVCRPVAPDAALPPVGGVLAGWADMVGSLAVRPVARRSWPARALGVVLPGRG